MTYVPDHLKEKIDHVARPPLPWRDSALTECGKPVAGHSTLTREAFLARLKGMGMQRTAMTVCMTCFDTARRHPSWKEDPAGCIAREVSWNRRDEGQFRRELLAVAALISRHRAEFDELLEDQKAIVPLTAKKKPAGARTRRW